MRPGGAFPQRGGSRPNARRGNSIVYALRAGLLILMAVLYGAFMVYVIAPHGTGRSTDDGAFANRETDASDGRDFPEVDWMEAGASMPRVIDRRKGSSNSLPLQTDAEDGRLDPIDTSEERFDLIRPTVEEPEPGNRPGCNDTNEGCASWAASGECQSNPGFMTHGCKVQSLHSTCRSLSFSRSAHTLQSLCCLEAQDNNTALDFIWCYFAVPNRRAAGYARPPRSRKR